MFLLLFDVDTGTETKLAVESVLGRVKSKLMAILGEFRKGSREFGSLTDSCDTFQG